MHIALVLTTGEGGIPHYTAELANVLATNHEVSLVKPKETTADELFTDDVSIYNWFENTGVSWTKITNLDINPVNVVKAARSYRSIKDIESLHPDIIHFTHQPHAYLRPMFPKDGFSCPVIQTYHEVYLSEHWLQIPGRDLPSDYDTFSVHTLTLSLDNILRKLITDIEIDGHIVHTKQNKDRIQSFFPEARIETIPHGSFSVFESGDGDIDPESNSVLFFGALRESKDIEQLVDAALLVQEDVPDLSVTISGSGNVRKNTYEKIRSRPDVFRFRNEFIPNEEVGDLFAKAQIVVIPHRHQHGHSGTLTIAFTHGKPVVATNVGEHSKLVQENGAGFVVEPGDSEAMAVSIKSLLTNDDLRERMSHNAKKVSEELSWESVADKTVSFYSEFLDRGLGPV